MREIKFRAWNGKMKRMFSAEEMAEDQMTLLPTGQFINVSSVSTKRSHTYDYDSMLPLQFTGLLDKNGKEIYEGDVVRLTKFSEGIEAVNHDGLAWWPWEGNTLLEGIGFVQEEVEIIGNVYENPELLK